jgi:hypothetical protein
MIRRPLALLHQLFVSIRRVECDIAVDAYRAHFNLNAVVLLTACFALIYHVFRYLLSRYHQYNLTIVSHFFALYLLKSLSLSNWI